MPNLRRSDRGDLPNLIVIGAMKCATTSLHYYLGLHPDIFMSREKELDFFIKERNWRKGIDWYISNFAGKRKIRGESSTSYTSYPFYKGVAKRMYSVIPDAKLIYILRHPIDRILSHYIHNYSIGQENRTIEEALKPLNNNRYICRSMYYMQIEQYLAYFPKRNIKIIKLDDLYSLRPQTLEEIFRFLNVQEGFYSSRFLEIKHRSDEKGKKSRFGLILKQLSQTRAAKIFSTDVRMTLGKWFYLPFSKRINPPVLEENLRMKILEYLREDISRLREFSGHDFEGWCM